MNDSLKGEDSEKIILDLGEASL